MDGGIQKIKDCLLRCKTFYNQILYMSYRLSIIEDIRNTRSRNEQNEININFERIIRKQQEMIGSLQQELLLLKSYLMLSTIHLGETTKNNEIEEDFKCKITPDNFSLHYKQKYQTLVRNLAGILQINKEKVIDQITISQTIKGLKQKLMKKNEPIFVQRIKQIKVPITIQKFIEKPVQRVIEKIVYVQKPTVIFKEKIIQRFVERKQQPIYCNSQKTLKISKYEKEREPQRQKQFSKNYQSDNNYRSQDIGPNLIKRRDNPSKIYVPKSGVNQRRYY